MARAGADAAAVELARARCQAAAEQDPADAAARRACLLLAVAHRRVTGPGDLV